MNWTAKYTPMPSTSGAFQYDSLYTCPAPGSRAEYNIASPVDFPGTAALCRESPGTVRNPVTEESLTAVVSDWTVCPIEAPRAMTIASDNVKRQRTTEYYPVTAAMASISTRASRGRRETSTVVLAGAAFLKYVAYTAFIAAKSPISVR